MTGLKKILILGSGGREHALARRFLIDGQQSKSSNQVYVSPGNPGISAMDPGIQILSDLSDHSSGHSSGHSNLITFCKSNAIDMVVVGPENLLADAIADDLASNNIPVYGPTKKSAMLETSKIYSKSFMNRYDIPTARSREYFSFDECIRDLKTHAFTDWSGFVIKLSGLHSGKGVFVTSDVGDALNVLNSLKQDKQSIEHDGFLLEEKLIGEEVSLFYSVLDDHYCFLGDACDHKRLLDHDQGPNTGGMGAFSPSFLTADDHRKIEHTILRPTIQGMIRDGHPFRGTLFLGVMVTDDKQFKVLEYNTRFGDPETQTLLPRIQGPFSELLHAVATRNTDAFVSVSREINLSPEKSVHVVKVASGYPDTPIKGDVISMTKESITTESTFLTFASVISAARSTPGTSTSGTSTQASPTVASSTMSPILITNGGRILGITSMAQSFEVARHKAYHALQNIHFRGEHFRTDIASRTVPIRIGILASGSGTNALQLIKHAQSNHRVKIACILVDRKDSKLLDQEIKPSLCDVPVHYCEKTSSMTKADHENAIIEILDHHRCTWILCAGFMRILSKAFIEHFNYAAGFPCVVNIHPSLLPAFKGKDAYKQAFDAGVRESGVTLHYVDEGVDTGPIIRQVQFNRDPNDTLETFTIKGRDIEWKIYPEFLDQIPGIKSVGLIKQDQKVLKKEEA